MKLAQAQHTFGICPSGVMAVTPLPRALRWGCAAFVRWGWVSAL